MTPKPEYRYTVYHSPVGPVYLLADETAILAVGLKDTLEDFRTRHRGIAPESWNQVKPSQHALLGQAVRSLQNFFKNNQPLPANLPLNPVGTPFQIRAWQAMRRIPYGQTRTYSQLAGEIGSPGASRAVGAACRANPIPLFIPCHRVIGAGGELRGFGGGGTEVKRQLLELENVR